MPVARGFAPFTLSFNLVVPQARRLAERICQVARDASYARICLDTLPTMGPAQKIYESLGFQPTEPYVFNPVAGTKFLSLALR